MNWLFVAVAVLVVLLVVLVHYHDHQVYNCRKMKWHNFQLLFGKAF